jgi:hypothetical protein
LQTVRAEQAILPANAQANTEHQAGQTRTQGSREIFLDSQE